MEFLFEECQHVTLSPDLLNAVNAMILKHPFTELDLDSEQLA